MKLSRKPLHIIQFFIILLMLFTLSFTVHAAEDTPKQAMPTTSSVIVDGSAVSFEAYNIDGNNYFKLRDIAMTLSGTQKQFNVGYNSENNSISLTFGQPYDVVGGEMSLSGETSTKTAVPTTSNIYLDGQKIELTAYFIDGNNFFKLRDIGTEIDFHVAWDDSTKTIGLDTAPIFFNDNALEVVIRDELEISTGAIYPSDMRTIEMLRIMFVDAYDISILKYCTNLQLLTIWETQISDISAIGYMKGLDYLRLDENKINDISILATINELKTLIIEEPQVNDFSCLSELNNLNCLSLSYLSNSPDMDLQPLTHLTNLTTITLKQAPGATVPDLASILSPLNKLLKICIWGYSHSVQELVANFPNAKQFDVFITYISNTSTHIGKSYDCLIAEELDDYEAFAGKIGEILDNNIEHNMTDREKVKAIHDYLLNSVSYNYNYHNLPNNDDIYNSYGAIMDGSAVCNGYANALCVLLNRVGVECWVVSGDVYNSDEGHAWNIVNVDGKYYHVDATWDDIGPQSTQYFLVNDSYMSQSRTWDTDYYPACP